MNLLTTSEKRIAVMIAEDLAPKQIAAEMGWTLCSLYHQISIIHQKLNVHSAVGVARIVIASGLIKL